LQEVVLHVFVNFHNCCFITTSITVVRCREDSHNITLVRPVISVHNKLMSTGNSSQTVSMVKLFRNILAKRVTSTSGGDTPTTSVIRVGPEEIANRSLMGNFLHSIELTDLIKSIDGRRKTTMEAEDLTLNNSSEW